MSTRTAIVATFAVAVLGSMASFILTTVAMDSLPDAALVGASGVVAFALAASLGGWRVSHEFQSLERPALYLALGGGALAFWAAPLLALTQRSSNAPSGSDTLFFTTTLWAVLVIAGAYLVRSERLALTGIAGAVCSAAGAAGLLASWEYPSSFSPFAKFPAREASMLVAGVLFAAGALALAEGARRLGVRYATTLGLGAAAALGVLASVPVLTSGLSMSVSAWRPSVYLGVAVALFAVSWTWLATRVGAARASASMLLVPPAMTGLVVYERATAVYGVVPFEMRGLAAGSAIAVMGVVVVLFSASDRAAVREARGRVASAAFWIAVASCVAAAVSLGTPALDALSEGHVNEVFRVGWTMLGYESAAGWMPVAAALLALTAAFEACKGQAARAWVVASLAVFACAVAMPVLSATTLHTWNTWIPAEVQQTYGTEYARFSVSAIIDPVRVAAMALAVVSAGVLGLSAAIGAKSARSTEAGS